MNEIEALILATLETFPLQALNVVSDSACCAYILQNLETSLLKPALDAPFLAQFLCLQALPDGQLHPLFMFHIRSHSALPGPLVQANDQVDRLVMTAAFLKARWSQQLFHLNQRQLHREFHLTQRAAQQVISQFLIVKGHVPHPHPWEFIPET